MNCLNFKKQVVSAWNGPMLEVFFALNIAETSWDHYTFPPKYP